MMKLAHMRIATGMEDPEFSTVEDMFNTFLVTT
jgi:hypothetical protein